MSPLLILLIGQSVIAAFVIFVLKILLDKELVKAAIEQFESCQSSPEIKEIAVRFSSEISDEFKRHLESIRQRKMPQASLNYEKDNALKGGVVIAVGDVLLDYSLSSRLQNFWS